MRGGRERDIHKERGIEELTYPESFTQKIGFDAIVELLQEECITESAAVLASRIKPVWPFGKLKLYLEQTAEFKQLLMLEKRKRIFHRRIITIWALSLAVSG